MDMELAGLPKGDERGYWMQVREGRIFYPGDPRPEEVYLEDIAHGLSFGCVRYNGMNDAQIFVSQHCVNAAILAEMDGQPFEVVRFMLLHDSPEAYIGDMIKPVKMLCPDFVHVEDNLEDAIFERFDVVRIPREVAKYYDNLTFAWEKRDLYSNSLSWDDTPEVPDTLPKMIPWASQHAKDMFLSMCYQYEIY